MDEALELKDEIDFLDRCIQEMLVEVEERAESLAEMLQERYGGGVDVEGVEKVYFDVYTDPEDPSWIEVECRAILEKSRDERREMEDYVEYITGVEERLWEEWVEEGLLERYGVSTRVEV